MKEKVEKSEEMNEKKHWIYEGSKILEKKKEKTIAIAIHTGFTSHKGRIIRKILVHQPVEPQFTHKILIFFVVAYLSAALVYLACLPKLL